MSHIQALATTMHLNKIAFPMIQHHFGEKQSQDRSIDIIHIIQV